MKKQIFIFLVSLLTLTGLELPSHAQYYGSYGYGCLTGCGGAYKASSIINLTVDSIDYGISLHNAHKAYERQLQEYQYQAEAQRSYNPQQLMQDYYNMKQVAPFFEDNNSPQNNRSPYPTVGSFHQGRVEYRR